MKKIINYLAIALSTMLLATSVQAKGDKHWGYMGETGPSHWSEVKKNFGMCSKGKVQSPINIIASKDVELKPLVLNYKSNAKGIINNGHTVQVNIKDGSVLKLDGLDYKLKQFHFHVPSENNINGNAFPLEAHFVHATDDGKLAVIGVMFAEGKKNKMLKKIWRKLSKLEVGHEEKFNLKSKHIKELMPKNKDYYKFMGSLTTPPCSENVKWYVYKNHLTVSKKQINKFFKVFGFPNNRPIQDTNKRVIEE